ncbi:hypothetical protein NDN08_004539 [Rhodosorus marinus]|uniref:Right handed beta helix domain-containing protein n=1 Tax=Rhodosorus marinus TaxID=101924 RepID=A0AAV8US50_9RHOD|nr:hypothetical protein NDN08_004539 [Rhodosorus marinus]
MFKMRVFVILMLVWLAASKTTWLRCSEDLEEQIESASDGDFLRANSNCEWTVDNAISIRSRITIRGVRAKLKSGVGLTAIFKVLEPGVIIEDFVLTGNKDSVKEAFRMSLILVFKSDVTIRNGVFYDSSQNGVAVRANQGASDIVGGLLENLEGHGCERDVVSISTRDNGLRGTRNITVKNIRAYKSRKKGAVEVSDGAEDIIVDNIYAERCVYAVDIQDHSKGKLESNNRIKISNVHAYRCKFAVRSETTDIGHSDIEISDVYARGCTRTMSLKNIMNLTIYNVRSEGNKGTGNAIELMNCDNLVLRDAHFGNRLGSVSAVWVKNSKNARVYSVKLTSGSAFKYGITVLATLSKDFESLMVEENDVASAKTVGIRILETNPQSNLGNIVLANNIGTIRQS